MMDELSRLLAVNGFLPHGYCITWSPPLVATFVVSDILIFLSYFSMPLALIYFARQRADFPFRWLLWMFSGFIMACGATHLMGAIVLWQPLYYLEATLKAITALVSVATAILLWPLIPHALKLPSPAQLKRVNDELSAEIVERRRVEEALRVAKEAAEEGLHKGQMLMAAIVESSEDAIIGKTTEGIVTSWNRGAVTIFGYAAEEIVGRSVRELVPAERQDEEEQVLASIRRGEPVRHFDTVRLRKDGGRIAVSVTVSPIRDKDSRIVGASKIARDMTAQKQVQAELEQHRLNLESLVQQRTGELQRAHNKLLDTQFAMDSVGIGIQWFDIASGRILYVNKFSADLLGYTVEEMLGMRVADIDPNYPAAEFQGATVMLLRQGRAQFESAHKAKDGRIIPVEITLHFAPGKGDELGKSIAFLTDITERKERELALTRAKEAAETATVAKSAFLANMSHEIRTPISAITGMAHLIRRAGATPEQAERLDKIDAAGRHLLEIVNAILDLSKIEAGSFPGGDRRWGRQHCLQRRVDTPRSCAGQVPQAARRDGGAAASPTGRSDPAAAGAAELRHQRGQVHRGWEHHPARQV